MKKITHILIIAVFVLAPAMAGAVEEQHFEANTTGDIVTLCTVSPDDPLVAEAINFCHGYLLGAYDYYKAATAGPTGIKLVCMDEPRPSRDETVAMFVDWAKDHPQYWDEPAVETEFRFLMETWPCN
ncbi:MAG: Rap1a/Tai family immunity protein [Desulfobacterales bacterium]|jgi:hypothetical protein